MGLIFLTWNKMMTSSISLKKMRRSKLRRLIAALTEMVQRLHSPSVMSDEPNDA